MQAEFVHLSVHSEFSLIDSVVRIKPLIAAVKQANMPAVALTDQSNLFALVKFYRAAITAGIKPIIGADVLLRTDGVKTPHRLRLLCQNQTGYRNLTELISRSYQHGQHNGLALLERQWLEQHNDGLIALSGGVLGEIGHAIIANNNAQAESALKHWLTVFPDRFYLELHRCGRPHEDEYIAQILPLASQHQAPVVATNDVCFIAAEDFAAHEVRVCIHDGRVLQDPRRPKHHSQQQYLRSVAEMQTLFADIPTALTNTVEISQRCNLQLDLESSYLPAFPVPSGETIEDYFIQQSQQGLQDRLVALQADGAWSAEKLAEYQQRLQIEIDVIVQMGFPGYFLIVADFIQWAKSNGVPVGPGRGSGAGSLVAYALGITDLDPLYYDLLFERFLNPERVSLPDFDVDFCMVGRDQVIDYVAEKYGRDRVSQIITYGTMAAKAVVRDVGRVLGHPYGFVDSIAKLIPFELGMTLQKALDQSDDLRQVYQNEEDVTALLDMALALEGLARNAGKHAGGVVIAPSKLTDFTPLYCEQDGQGLVTQLDKDDVESIGLVKFDFLGLRTLTIIDCALKTINAAQNTSPETAVNIEQIPLDDSATFKLLCEQRTTAVFQLESRGMKDLIKRLQPDSFDDIIALVALFRPGPLQSGMVDDFIERKHGKMAIDYPHPALEPILCSTYGVILYQEQVMQIAQVLAGYSLGGADLLRRAMGKKKPEEMAKQRAIFMEGALANQVDEETATYIFDLMEKFAGYGFNKSHSAAYALLSYQTAWLKAHYPSEFMASVLSADMDNTDKIVRLIDECRQLGLDVVPPDISVSNYTFSVDQQARIVYGLGAIKGLGEAAIEAIVQERHAQGPFQNLLDFCQRVDSQKLNKRALEALIRGGAMDSLQLSRASLIANLATAMQYAEQNQRNKTSGQSDIFADDSQVDNLNNVQWQDRPEWDEADRLAAEKETLGVYLTGHPIHRYQQELLHMTGKRIIEQIENYQAKKSKTTNNYYNNDLNVLIAGWVVNMRGKQTRNGKMVFLALDDQSAQVDVMVRPEDVARHTSLLARDTVLIIEGGLSADDFSGGYRVRAKQLYDLDAAREKFGQGLEIAIGCEQHANGFIQQLEAALSAYKNGTCPVWIRYAGEAAQTRLRLGKQWQVQPREQLLQRLQTLVGSEQVRVLYSAANNQM